MQPVKEITECCYRYILPKISSEEEQVVEPIPAQEVIQAIKSGKSIEIINAVIEGPLNLESLVVNGKIKIQGTKIKGQLDCSYAEFKQVLDFHSTTFHSEVKFTGATIAKDIILRNTTFHEKSEFTDMIVEGALYGELCKFLNEVDFVATQIKRRAVFTKGIFEQKAMFTGFNITGTGFFDSTVFIKEANFGSAQINGRAIFEGAIFKDDFNFASVRIGACAEFKNTLFKKNAVFHMTQIEESAFFHRANFEGTADFRYIQVGSNVEFNGAIFNRSAIFNSAHIEGHALFNPDSSSESQSIERVESNPTIFKGEADFAATVFNGGATFLGARFSECADFFSSRINMDAGFADAVFYKDVRFLNASFRTLFFSKSQPNAGNQFKGKIDLRGCTYDRIEPISVWEQLMDQLEPYDRQPFSYLEQTFRRAGEDFLANKVYYERKRTESARISVRRTGGWLLDRLHWWLTGYGVQLWRILIAFAVILIIGTFIFHIGGAVELKQTAPSYPVTGNEQEGQQVVALTYIEAFWVSFNLFLPVSIPSGAEWKPSSRILWGIKFTSIATVWKLLGWMLVPIGIAGLTGWLKR
ncbi:MAG: pentapeptide repeat-containing protein [Candidatus Zixiibacteriota bacterium]